MFRLSRSTLVLYLVFVYCESSPRKPHIIFILADDLGWNDVGFHGSNQIPTPNIDALAYSGILLQKYYVTPICTPSRASLMTGKYAIHTGMQHTVIFGAEPRGLPLSEKILPQYLKDLQYKTHLVGKWHLGSYKKEYLPLYRGFDSHLGFWTGKIDMYDHINMEKDMWGHDFRRGFNVAYDMYGKYATDVFTEEAVKIINAHNKREPLFLMVAHAAVHSGNPYEYIRAPDYLVNNFTHIQNYQRRKFAGMLTRLDESVGKVVAALQRQGLLENSIVVFSSDNGGPAEGFNDNAASNYPLRGVKNTLWEGGVRGAGLLWSPLLAKTSRVASQRMHIVDWLPTLLSVAGYNISTINNLDGIDQWETLSKNLDSKRNSIVHNIDDVYGSAAITKNQWKLHKGTNYNGDWDNYYGPSGRKGVYNIELIRSSFAAMALKELNLLPSTKEMFELREAGTVKCNSSTVIPCYPLQAPCLFNIDEDPCEMKNLAKLEPKILQDMQNELNAVNKTAVSPNNKLLDPLGDPRYWGKVFVNFGDYETNAQRTCL